jgi:general stress protein YciG
MPRHFTKEIASLGGKAAHAKGTAHEWTPEEASAAGRLGGNKIAKERGSEYMRELGRRGAAAKVANRIKRQQAMIEAGISDAK